MKAPADKFTFASLALLVMTGCASIGPPLPPSLELPKPPTDLRASRKGNTVTLTWTIPLRTTDRQTVTSMGATRVCRGASTLAECGMPVGEVPAPVLPSKPTEVGKKQSAQFTDTLTATSDDPQSIAVYAVEVMNQDGRSAGLSNRATVAALKMPGPPKLSAQAVKDGVSVSWQVDAGFGSNVGIAYKLRIYRRTSDESKALVQSEFAIDPNVPQGTFVDKRIEWEKTYLYRAEVVTAIARSGKPDILIEGDDSPEVQLFAHDVFPPSVPSGLQAVFSSDAGAGFIDLIWTPVSDTDLAGYKVYRHESGAEPVLFNAKPLNSPAFRDTNVVSGKSYFYSVSAVDTQGNESERSAEATEHVP